MKYMLIGEETERLTFRKLEQRDFEEWTELFEEQNVAKFLGLDQSLNASGLCKAWYDKTTNRYANNLGGMNVLIDKKTNRFIGQCGLLVQTIDDEERLEVGYSILPKYWNQGYAFEAAFKCKNYAFENDFANSLVSVVHIENIGSEKVALKNGMTFEKKTEDVFNVFSISKTTWDKK
ncbi:GNAT family N-acetyltransferase [Aquimarina sp. D1M17]|uniref:GNAT family N-acetyltransferase n=1 Tax=Aquimarina acroporae TaxID=2937283 RepID=UPI0020BDC73D|nr:GNAT family N-acetyltransferase [Aquimarina acroporae]MCK8523919.1 GNAT family N-acetyltransferase [Aquimarina acroporae]